MLTDIENMKKTEVNRRRRLRLEQVRQQSRDIAHHIRQKVRHELGKQGNAFARQQNAELKRLQARRLLLLQQHYQDCLDEVGMGHMQAALQPDAAGVLEAERKRNWTQAKERGREATADVRLKLADMEQRKNAPRQQQIFVRAVEDVRSAVVTSLQKKSLKRTPKKGHHHQQEQPLADANVPHCRCGCALCICPHQQIVTAGAQEIKSPSESQSQQVHKEKDNTVVSVGTSDILSESSCSAESRFQACPASSTTTSSLTKVQKSRVQFYDHGNRFEGNLQHQIRVERMFPHAYELDAIQAAEVESQNFATSKFILDDETSNKLHGRGQQALVRERLCQDYRQLLDDLHALAREERLLRSTLPYSLPTEIFQEDYRHKELYTERQRNMDSVFESLYHNIQQHLISHPSPVAGSHGSHQWEMMAQDSPARLNVAKCQTLSGQQQKATSPINIINVAPTSTNTDIATGVVCSEKKVLTLKDLIDRINFQHSLLMDEMNMHGSVPQDPLSNASSDHKKENIHIVDYADQSCAEGSSTELKSSLHEVHDDISLEDGPSLLEVHDHGSHEEGLSLHEVHDDFSLEEGLSLHEVHHDGNYEEGCTHNEQKVTLSAEGFKDEVSLGGRRNSDNHKFHYEKIINLPVECEKHRDHKGSRESDAVVMKVGGKQRRKHGKEKVKDKTVKEWNLVSEVHQTDQGKIDVTREDNSITVLSEYSFDMSVARTREHNIELSSGTSSSSSYEGVKVVVSVSELTEKKCQSTAPRKCAVNSSENTPQEAEKHEIVRRKVGDWKHKQHYRDNRSVKEKATMTAEGEVEGSAEEKFKTDLMIKRRATKTREGKDMKLDRTKKWRDMVSTNAVPDKALSEGSTSYMSLPDQLVASNIQHLGKLLAAWHDYQKEGGSEICEINPWLAGYISRLLAMNRKCVEDLHVSTSDISASDAETNVTEGLHETMKHSTKEETEMKHLTKNEIYTYPRPEVPTIKQLINAVKEKTRVMTDKVTLDYKAVTDSRQACPVMSVPHAVGPHSYDEFRHCDIKIQSTSTPETWHNSHEITETELCEAVDGVEDVIKKCAIIQEHLLSSCRCDDNSCDFDMKTPPFTSVISDMSLDEYKIFKFPEIFSDYSEKCSQRISHLTKKIEQIRDEKKKLIESTGSSSINASSSIDGYDSTKYLSLPEMICLPSEGKGPVSVKVSVQKVGDVPFFCNAGNEQQMFQNKELPKSISSVKPNDGNETRVQQQEDSQWNRPHNDLPLCLWRHKLQCAVNTEPMKELSTVTEGVSKQTPCSSSCNSKEPESVTGEKSKNNGGGESLKDECIPDVMTDMLRRGLITSPLAWTKAVQQSDDETSVSEVLIPGLSNDNESKAFTASSPQHAEHEKFKQAVLESYVGKGTGSPESFRDRQSIADRKMGFSQQVAETFAKLGKNPSRTDVTNAFKNLGLKWKARGRDQYVNPVISKEGLDPASEEFRQQVLESFVGLGLDSSPEDLEAAFQRLGLDCPGAYLCRSDVNELKHTHRFSVTPESAETVRSNIQFYDPSRPMSNTVLPPEHPSDPASFDDSVSS